MIDLRVVKAREASGAARWLCVPEGICVGAADSNNVETIKVHLPEEWAVYTVRLTMRPYRKPAVALIVKDGDEVTVTGNMTCGRGGTGEIVFDAAGPDGEVTYTARGPYYTYAHGQAGGEDPGYTPDAYQQMAAMAAEAVNAAEAAKEAAKEASATAGSAVTAAGEAEAAAEEAAADAKEAAGKAGAAEGSAAKAAAAASAAEKTAAEASEKAGTAEEAANASAASAAEAAEAAKEAKEAASAGITVDQTVTEGSKNPVSGGAVKEYVDRIAGDVQASLDVILNGGGA